MCDKAVEVYYWVKENVKYSFPKWHSAEVTKLTRKGYCAAKSELLVSMLRDIGIKARYVEGHETGLRKLPIMMVQGLDAHYWVEARVDNKWLTLDPTPDSGIVCLWGNTEPGMHLGNPKYIQRWAELPGWYKEGYNSFLLWPFRFLTNVELMILRLIWRFKLSKGISK